MSFNKIIQATLLFFLLASFTEARGQASFGSTESIVNTTTSNNQIEPTIAMNSSGEYIVVWASEDQDGDDYGIYFQYYDSSGTAFGSETLVESSATYTVGAQRHPTVTLDNQGEFSIAWMSDGTDGDGQGIYFKRFTTGSVALTSTLRMNNGSAGEQKHPDIAGDSSGNCIVVFGSNDEDGDGFGIAMRRRNDAGSALAGDEQINESATGNQTLPKIAMSPTGAFVVTWQSDTGDGDASGIFARLYDNSPTAVTSEFQVNTTTAAGQQEPDVAMAADGSFIIVWTSYNQDGDAYGIYGQRYNASGVAQGSEFLVNTTTAGTQNHPTITANTDGDFIVFWDSYGQDGSMDGVYYQAYQKGGIVDGDEGQVNIQTNDFQQFPAAAWYSGDLGLKVAWQSGLYNATSTQDASNYGIVLNTAVVSDTTAPTAVCQDITVYLDGSGNASILPADIDNGSSDNTGIQTYSLDDSSFACGNIGNNTVTLTVTDSVGLVDSCTATVNVQDTIAPTAICNDLTVHLDGTGNASITASDVNNGSTDNCTVNSTSLSVSAFTCTDVGVTSVTLTAQDFGGNTGTCTSNITVLDTTAPTAVCQDVTVYLDGAGSATVATTDIDNGSSDNCSNFTSALSVSGFGCTEIGANTTTLTVTDAGMNVDSCSATVTVLDSIAPTMVCSDISVFLDGSGAASLAAADIDGGSSDNCSSLSLSISNTAFTCADIGTVSVVLTGDDGNGNTATCTSSVVVVDSVAPTMVCQSITVQLDGTGAATITANDVDGGSSDNCTLGTTSIDVSTFACTDLGSNTVVLSAADGSGNSANCSAAVTVEDNISPTAVCQDVTVHLSATGAATIGSTDVENGSTDNCVVTGTSLSNTSFVCADVGANTVTLTATDASGNTGTCTANIQVIDSVSPTATCQDVTLQLDAGGAATLTTTAVDNNSADACGINTLTLNATSFGCADIGTLVVTLTVDDANGNSSTCTSNITIEDVLAPVMVCQDLTVQLDVNGNGSTSTSAVDGGTSDNCQLNSTSINDSIFTCSDVGSNPVILTADDANGNSANCTATITVEDNIAPVAVCQDLTVYLDGLGAASIVASGVDNGSSDACGIASQVLDNDAFGCSDVGNNTVTLTTTDVNANSNVCTASIQVLDTIAPGAICQNISVFLNGSGLATLSGTDLDGGSTDNCSVTALSSSIASFSCLDIGTNSATLTATDPSGNTTTCIANVNVLDTISPIPTCIDVTVQLNSSGTASISLGTVSSGSTDNCAVLTQVLDVMTFSCIDVGANNITLTATDVNGNDANCVSIVTIEDQIAPLPVCQSLNLFLDGTGNGSISTSDIDNGSTDNCVIAGLSLSKTTFGCNDLGNNTVVMTATDASGNQASCNSFINVQDTTTPIAICTDVTLYLSGTGNATLTTSDVGNGSSDNCGISLTNLTQTSFDCQDVGVIPVTLTQSDVSSNSVDCTVNITIEDSTSPIMLCTNFNLILNSTGSGAITTATIDGGSSDNCGIASLQVSQASFDCSDVGINAISLDAVDVNGNTSSCISQVNVLDQEDPIIACQNVTAYLDGSGTATVLPSDVDAGSTDNCAIDTSVLSITNFTCNDLGANFVGMTILDASGNSSICAVTVTVIDSTAPVAVCQNISVQLDANGQFILTAAQIDNGSADNCAIDSFWVSKDTFGCADVGANIVTLAMDDVSGNADTCTTSLFITDSVAPIAQCQALTVTLDANGVASITTADVDAGSSDNCSINTLTISQDTFGCADVGTVPVTLSVTDLFGNVTTCSSNVTVQDTVDPIAMCASSIVVSLGTTGNASISVSDVDMGSSDNCNVQSTALSQTSFSCADLGTQTQNLVVIDVNGNTDTCTYTVLIQDTLAPNANCQNFTTVVDSNGFAAFVPADLDNNSTDNCSAVILSTSQDTLGCGDVGFNPIRLYVQDASGNIDSCNAILTLDDQIDPVAICDDITAYLDVTGNITVTETDVASNSFDNCTLSFNLTNNSFDCSDLGVNTVIVSMTDPSNNSNSCFSQVTVEDSTAPVVLCQDITVTLDVSNMASITLQDVTAGPPTDNCNVGTPMLSNSTFDCSSLGVNVIDVSVPDGNGNTGVCQSLVTVVDSAPPVANCQGLTVELDSNGVVGILAADLNDGSTDNCAVDSFAVSSDTLSCGDVGTTTVTLFVFDASQNVDSCDALITVQDNVLPAAVCTPDTIGIDTGQVIVVPASDVDGGSFDNCGVDSLTLSPNSFTSADLGLNNVTLTVIDVNGNASSCTTTVLVEQMVGIEDGVDLQASLQFSAYPNPTQGLLQIEVGCIDCIFREDARLTLVDLRGKVLVDQRLKKNRANHTLEIDMSNYALGTYLLRLETERGEAVQHIVKY